MSDYEIGHYFDILGIEPTPYIRKMRARIMRKPGHSDAEYDRYYCAMDAICSRKPERMSENGLEMLSAKVHAISNAELRRSAHDALDELRREILKLAV